jgi:HrpA-like RNA helicase
MDFIVQPEIFKVHLGLVILQLLSCGIEDPLNYDLIDKPDRDLMVKTLNDLVSLKLVESNLLLTAKDKLAADMFLEPSVSRMVLKGLELNIAFKIVTLPHYKFDQVRNRLNKKTDNKVFFQAETESTFDVC